MVINTFATCHTNNSYYQLLVKSSPQSSSENICCGDRVSCSWEEHPIWACISLIVGFPRDHHSNPPPKDFAWLRHSAIFSYRIPPKISVSFRILPLKKVPFRYSVILGPPSLMYRTVLSRHTVNLFKSLWYLSLGFLALTSGFGHMNQRTKTAMHLIEISVYSHYFGVHS